MKKLFTFLLLSLLTVSIKLAAQTVSTYAGSTQGYAEGTGATAQFNRPYGIAFDGGGAVVVTDQSNYRVRMVYSNQSTASRAGNGTSGNTNGTGTGASFGTLAGVARDGYNNSFVCDVGNNSIKKITATGEVTTYAGGNGQGSTDGHSITTAQFYLPYGIACDAAANTTLYVADTYNHRIRVINSSFGVSTLAGSTQGYTDATGTSAQFNYPMGITVDASNNVYVIDGGGTRLRKITPAGVVTTLASGFSQANCVTVDNSGNLYVGDASTIKKVTPTGTVSIYAGTGTSGNTDGDVSVAGFWAITGITIDKSNNILYVADNENHRIRKILPPPPATAPSISSVSPINITHNSASITYSLNANGASTTSQLKYGLSASNLLANATGTSATGNTATAASVNLSFLQPSTQYFYQIEATNSEGTTTSSVSSFTTLATPPPVTFPIVYNFNNTYLDAAGNRPFTSNAGTSFISDRHGNANGAININNTGTTVSLPDLPYSSSARTVSLWVKMNNVRADYNYLYCYGVWSNPQGATITNTTVTDFGPSHSTTLTNAANTWYHFVFTYNGTQSKIYRNGTLINTLTVAKNTGVGLNTFSLGLTELNQANYFNGAVDDLKIYDRAITDAEVSNLFNNNTLPVNLVSFTAKAQNNSTILNWETASETNNSHFVVKRSIDGINFNTLTTVVAKSENGASYQYIDKNPVSGTNYYQLLQIDLDGKTTDLGIKDVSFSIKDGIKIFPNPTVKTANISFTEGIYLQANLIDINGKTLQSSSISKTQQLVSFDLETYPNGIYFIQLSGNTEKSTQKIIKQ